MNIEARDLAVGDRLRFPDGDGGHVWPTVLRVTAKPEGRVELLLGSGDNTAYKTLDGHAPVVVKR